MSLCSTVMKTLIFFTFSLHLSSADTQSLQYSLTQVTGTKSTEFSALGLVSGQQFGYYNSAIRKVIPKTEWMQKVKAEDPEYWKTQKEIAQIQEESFKVNLDTAMQCFYQTTGVHTLQRIVGCELDDDGTVRGYNQFGYDGEDFISLDLKTLTWTAAKPQAEIIKYKRNNDIDNNKMWKNFLEYRCIEWLKTYVNYSRKTLNRKVRPTASVFQKHSPSPEVVCHATGFFPKAVMIFWRKDGEEVHEDVELRETLPNQDGSFQKRSILKVPAEELQKHTYTCVIQHSSLEKELVLNVSERQILKGGGSMAIIIGVVVALIVLVVAVVAGIMVWKKKNSGFKRAPASEESSSNNS
ncbi:BOLA class I histocompatibility antigen, alpha chain BL3-7-like [Tachysurus vachellii]|uniref:BOLA class I histocompatibility antigen, alpha chain BL3-7-like n=1 Tax=Tachysurus vachellii TaxID=175792 RepID=UPI00296B3470|nr:BOLA class I histocompatibility antigen, alpha chain BL3-7-like [Tachysurus vachellii]